MKKIVRTAYAKIAEEYELILNEKLAKEIETDINSRLVEGEIPVEITVEMLEDVAEHINIKDCDWERSLCFKFYVDSLYNFIEEWLDDAIWEEEPREYDYEVLEYYDDVREINKVNE